MGGPVTAERGAGRHPRSDPPRVRRLLNPRMLIILSLAVVLAGGGVLWVLYGSPWMRVQRVSVFGTRVLTADQVRQAAAVRIGSPLVSLGTDAIEARVRRELPRTDSVHIVRSWPHAIGVKVTERIPVLVVKKGVKFVEVDSGGVRFATVSQPPQGVPVLELTVSRPAGGSRFGDARLVPEVAGAVADVPPGVGRGIRTVRVRSYDSISLELSDGRSVMWGSGENGHAKAVTLTALMKAAPGARHFDVSVPTAPASSSS